MLSRLGSKRTLSLSTRQPDGLLVLSMEFRNPDGSIIAKFDEDGFIVMPPYIGRHPNKSTLKVWDSHGVEFTKVVYVNKRLLRLKMPSLGIGTEVLSDEKGPSICLPPGAGIELGPNGP
jgi:hypothetical protein